MKLNVQRSLEVRKNPELLIMHNPYGKGSQMRKRRKKRNPGSTHRMRARIGKKYYSYHNFISKWTKSYKRRHPRAGKGLLRKANAAWKRSRKVHGKGKRKSYCYPSRRIRKIRYNPRKKSASRRRKTARRSSWKTLVKRYGVRKAAKMYKKPKQAAKRRTTRRKKRSFRR